MGVGNRIIFFFKLQPPPPTTRTTPCSRLSRHLPDIHRDLETRPEGPAGALVSLAFSSGSISLHRLQWQKIWTAEAGEEEVVVGALAWRPDGTYTEDEADISCNNFLCAGKLLAAGDSAGVLTIRHIESSAALHTEQVKNHGW